MESHINWLATIVAALSSILIGFVWYNKNVFGKAWMKSLGITEEHAKGANMPVIFGVTILVSIIASIYFARIMGYHGTEDMTIKHGLFHGSEAAAYIALPVIATNAMFEMRKVSYILINVGYWWATLCAMAVIHSVWR
ncbi:MAG: DUF1761 domain-containing protein [Flavobacteriales bacterium]|nr:DUF1761 domain-containing protein [Flavobacteriales bacterium]